MKLSIRVKLVSLLIVVGMLPLVAALLTITIGVKSLLTETLVHGFQYSAVREAGYISLGLSKDIEKLVLTFNDWLTVQPLAAITSPMPVAQRDALDKAWRNGLSPDDPRVASILKGNLPDDLRGFQCKDPRLVELLVTDRFGQLVAATGMTTDFYQADETWWQETAKGPVPRIYVSPVRYDRSAGVYSISLCVPITRDEQLVGVGKAVIDISRMVTSSTIEVAGSTASVTITRSDGTIIYKAGVRPLSQKQPDWTGPITTQRHPGWQRTSHGLIEAFAPIKPPQQVGGMQVVMPARWSYILTVSEVDALAKVVRLSMIVLASGVFVILLVFLVGLLLVDRIVVRRIYALRGAVRSVIKGDLSHRSDLARPEHWAADEINELAEDFNNMIDRIERTHESLRAADQLKMDFIRIAGHELRTPVSYILGTVRLLMDSRDPERLAQAIQTMGAKAKRLDEIIQAMFKLMPDHPGDEEIHYDQIKVADLLEAVYLDCFPFVEQRGQRLLIEGANRVPSIQADKAKLRDILGNLVINAIKFTPDGGTVKVRISRQLGEYISFAVQDQGRGIPEEDLPYIFQPFYSGSDVMRHSSGQIGYAKKGMGLGLAIVKHFVELHGGTVSVSSQPHGSVFTVTIPISKP